MAGEDARLKSGLKTAEDELNLIKNQIQQTLLDIREHILDVTNPFNDVEKALGDEEEMAIEDSGGGGGGGALDEAQSDSPASSLEDDDSLDESATEEGADDALAEDELFDDDFPEEDFEEIPEDDVYGTEPMSSGGPGDEYVPGQSLNSPYDEFEPDEEEEGDGNDTIDEFVDDAGANLDEREDAVSKETAEDEMAADGELDLVKLASLVRWVAVTQSRLGPQRTEVLLDTYVAAGRISSRVRSVMGLMCNMADEDPDGSIPVRDIIASMVRMEGVLSVEGGASSPNRLLGMLLELDDDPLDRMAA